MPPFIPLPAKYWSKVVVRDGCWGWKGATTSIGYGEINHLGKIMYAHRVSWEIHKGPIPKGMDVLHHCDNPPCSNPACLFLGTASDNIRDCWSKGRRTPGRSGRGLSKVPGVVWDGANRKWVAMRHRSKLKATKNVYLGRYDTIEEAKRALETR